MADKTVSNLYRSRGAALITAAATTTLAVIATILSDMGTLPGAWHRVILEITTVSWFAVIAATCTLSCMQVVQSCARTRKRDMAAREERFDSAMEGYISTAVEQAIDQYQLHSISTELRRRDGLG